MNLTRRALGVGLAATGAAATGGYLLLEQTPLLRNVINLRGFVGGEKLGFLADPATTSALRRQGFELSVRQAGSVEMVREPALLQQDPTFLWPSSSVMVEIAKQNHVAVRRSQVILNSPLVVQSWESIATGLAAGGMVKPAANGVRMIDLEAFLRAILAEKEWSELGVPELYGKARIVSTDPNLSNSGFMFAGLAANLLAGSVATTASLPTVSPDMETIFRRMGFKSSSSGSLFEDYLSGGPGAYPMVVLYENQLIQWALADPSRWQRVLAGPSRPVTLYPEPTVYSAHPLISLKPDADPLIDALMSPDLQEIAWTGHGFRGPLGMPGTTLSSDIAQPPSQINAVPMPEAAVMLALLQRLAA